MRIYAKQEYLEGHVIRTRVLDQSCRELFVIERHIGSLLEIGDVGPRYKISDSRGNIIFGFETNNGILDHRIELKNNNESVGLISYGKEKAGLIFKLNTIELDYNGEHFTCYRVGDGTEWIHHPVYHNNTQIALIEQSNKYEGNIRYYKLYIEDEQLSLATVLMFIGIDHRTRFGVIGDEAGYKGASKEWSLIKAEKEKHDPDFINRC